MHGVQRTTQLANTATSIQGASCIQDYSIERLITCHLNPQSQLQRAHELPSNFLTMTMTYQLL